MIKNKSIISIILIAILSISTCFTGCGSDSEEEEIPNTPVTTPVKTASAQVANKTTATPKATKVVEPELYDVSFTLKMDDTQDYTEYTLPIYLAKTHIIHMNWLVQKGGDHFYMSFTLPNGKMIGINENGTLSNYTQGQTSDKLYNGNIVMCPNNSNWGDGYYMFHPNICGEDEDVTVKLIYWIETP